MSLHFESSCRKNQIQLVLVDKKNSTLHPTSVINPSHIEFFRKWKLAALAIDQISWLVVIDLELIHIWDTFLCFKDFNFFRVPFIFLAKPYVFEPIIRYLTLFFEDWHLLLLKVLETISRWSLKECITYSTILYESCVKNERRITFANVWSGKGTLDIIGCFFTKSYSPFLPDYYCLDNEKERYKVHWLRKILR